MTSLLVTCKVLGQSPLQLDQYRSSIKSPILLYSSYYGFILNYDFNHNCDYTQLTRFQCQPTLQLETAFVNQYCFCNTELRTATVTKIKGLSIQTQQNTFVLFTLFKLTLDERKTLTKISTRKPLTTVPQTSARFGHDEIIITDNKSFVQTGKKHFAKSCCSTVGPACPRQSMHCHKELPTRTLKMRY